MIFSSMISRHGVGDEFSKLDWKVVLDVLAAGPEWWTELAS